MLLFYKESYVCPLHRKGDRANTTNYRPVSLTSHIIKIFERVLRKTVIQYLEVDGILSQNQHCFRSSRSCLTQVPTHFNDTYNSLINDEVTDSIYLDYAKVFDKVDHKLLICNLKLYKFHPKLVNWISLFLSDRYQKVINGHHSYKAPITSGVI